MEINKNGFDIEPNDGVPKDHIRSIDGGPDLNFDSNEESYGTPSLLDKNIEQISNVTHDLIEKTIVEFTETTNKELKRTLDEAAEGMSELADMAAGERERHIMEMVQSADAARTASREQLAGQITLERLAKRLELIEAKIDGPSKAITFRRRLSTTMEVLATVGSVFTIVATIAAFRKGQPGKTTYTGIPDQGF